MACSQHTRHTGHKLHATGHSKTTCWSLHPKATREKPTARSSCTLATRRCWHRNPPPRGLQHSFSPVKWEQGPATGRRPRPHLPITQPRPRGRSHSVKGASFLLPGRQPGRAPFRVTKKSKDTQNKGSPPHPAPSSLIPDRPLTGPGGESWACRAA